MPVGLHEETIQITPVYRKEVQVQERYLGRFFQQLCEARKGGFPSTQSQEGNWSFNIDKSTPALPIIGSISLIRSQLPHVNRRARRRLVAINEGWTNRLSRG